jgi:hypothetical protein
MMTPSESATVLADPGLFTAPERDLIRHEFYVRFGQAPRLADGILLRTWRGGPQAGQPKIPKVVQGLIDRGLLRLAAEKRLGSYQVVFTPAGMAALSRLAQDRRALNPEQFAHLHEELAGSGAAEAR